MAYKRNTIRRQRPASHESRRTDGESGPIAVPNKPRRKRHTFLRVIIRLIIATLLITGGVYIWQNWDTLAPESAIYWLNDKLAGGQKGDGFPVEITGSSVINMTNTKDGLALLTDTSMVVFNSKGGELFRRQHGFSKPIMLTNDKWILLADIGGKRLRIESRASTAAQMTTENNIVSAALGRGGNFALVTDSTKGYTSEVVAYNRHQEVIYQWLDRELTVLDVALSPDGKSMVVVGVKAEEGAMKTIIKFLDFNNKQEPAAQYDSTDLMLLEVEYFPGGTVAAVGDSALWVFNKSGSIQQKHSFEDRQMAGFTFSERSVSVALRNFGGAEGGSLLTVNSTGDKAYNIPFQGMFRDLASYKSGALILTSNKLYRTDASGVSHQADVIRDGRMISALGNKAIVLGLTSLYEAKLPIS